MFGQDRASGPAGGNPAAPDPPARRRRWWRRPGLVALAIVAMLALFIAAGLGGLLVYGNMRIDREDIAGLAPWAPDEPEAASVDGQRTVGQPAVRELNVLVVGSDRRDGQSRVVERQVGGQANTGTQRADTILLVSLRSDGSRAAALSFPRDLKVERCDGTIGKINGAYDVSEDTPANLEGGSCLVKTISALTGVKINHYIEVDFDGFLDVVDTLGGVTLWLDEPLQDDKSHLDLPAGCVTLKGTDALAFVRARRIDSDFGRIARQQRFLREVLEELTSAGTLANVPRLVRLVDKAAGAIRTDRAFGLSDMRRLAMGLRNLDSERLRMRTVPGEAVYSGGVWYVEADEARAQQLYAAFADGRILDPPAPRERKARKTPRPAMEPEQVPPVLVRNAAGTSGLASSVAAALQGQGFSIAGIRDAEEFGATRTLIAYPQGQRRAAKALRSIFPGAELVGGAPALSLDLGADVNQAALAALQAGRAAPATPQPPPLPKPEPEPTFAGAAPSERDC